ncbi:hypothetical protein [Kribbella sp. CA-293567]|nr:hypothetical protein [Kribbella sp. CA-293567]WBQ04904.1 hypothetical protein OX958_33750 [Kribbella sp. CA-293567]
MRRSPRLFQPAVLGSAGVRPVVAENRVLLYSGELRARQPFVAY